LEKIDQFIDPEAKAAIAWILGEFGEHVTNADQHLQTYFIQKFTTDA
jgi:hypothetical protein